MGWEGKCILFRHTKGIAERTRSPAPVRDLLGRRARDDRVQIDAFAPKTSGIEGRIPVVWTSEGDNGMDAIPGPDA